MPVDGAKTSSPVAARSPEFVPRTQSRWAGYVPALIFSPLVFLGGVMQLAVRVLREAIFRPFGYWKAVRDEMFFTLKLAWFPIVAAITTFGLMVGIQCVNFTRLPGAPNRCGQYFFIVNLRDFSPWINSLVVAGVVGAAICADLGARKIREELDALDVLGVDPIRELVLPRMVSITLLTPMFLVISVMIIMVDAMVSSYFIGDVPISEYLTLVYSNLSPTEITGGIIKALIVGFTIGIVCAFKGLDTTGGAIGVGRAVNQAVVISFVAVFTISGLFNMILLGLFPNMQVLR
jgi:phospholipid/cholesterol/gamma-HCH transport system permease protein